MAFALATVGLWAQRITEKEAQSRALKYLESKYESNGRMAQARNGKPAFKSVKVEADGIYAFNIDGGGFIIVSADSRTLPVLGYSDKGKIDWDRMPSNMRAWLQNYDNSISSLGKRMDLKDGNPVSGHDDAVRSSRRSPKSAVEPLIKTRWYQNEPYWNRIPLYGGADPDWAGRNCYTGCVATSMAQIMKYYEWPKAAVSGMSSYVIPTAWNQTEIEWQIDSLPPVSFDWDNMLYAYDSIDYEAQMVLSLGNELQRDAVAVLMRYCAQSVQMDFSPGGSGAFNSDVPNALYKNFDYSPSALYAERYSYGIDEWEELVYNELSAGRPVVYGGFSDSYSGHSFICDGYDGDGLFHFNWGWGGSYDGYFSLSVLAPLSHGVGYSLYEEVIFGIRPSYQEDQSSLPLFIARLNNETEIAGKDNIYFYYSFSSQYLQSSKFGNNLMYDVTHDYAMGTVDEEGHLNPCFIGDPSDSIVYDYNMMVVVIDSTLFKPGERLTLYPMIRFRNVPGSDWQLMASKDFCIYAGCTQDGDFYLEYAYPDLEIVDAAFTYGSGLAGESSDLTLVIRNNNSTDFTDMVELSPAYHGNISIDEIAENTQFTTGENIRSEAYLRGGEESDVIFNFTPEQSGLVELRLTSSRFGELTSYVIKVNDSADGVSTLYMDMQDLPSNRLFDLNGRRLDDNSAPKGLYIKDNKIYLPR